MPTNHTPHYNLNQWERDDRILMEDFNADNAKIDAAIKAEAGARAAGDAALQAALGKKGNCQLWTATYQGTGQYGKDHPNSFTFPKPPTIACIIAGHIAIFVPGQTQIYPLGNLLGIIQVSWNGNTMSWYSVTGAAEQFNSGGTYRVVALMPA